MREVSFVVDHDAQQAAFGSAMCAVFRTAADGTLAVPVMVMNQSDQCMAADHEDAIMEVLALQSEDVMAIDSAAAGRRTAPYPKVPTEFRSWSRVFYSPPT